MTTTDTRRATLRSSPMQHAPSGPNSPRHADTPPVPEGAARGEDTTTRPAEMHPAPSLRAPGGATSPADRMSPDTRTRSVGGGQNTRPATMLPASIPAAPGGSNDTPVDPSASDARTSSVDGGTDIRPATLPSASQGAAPGGSDSLADLTGIDARSARVGEGHDNRTGHTAPDITSETGAGAVQDSGTGQRPTGDRKSPAGAAPDRPAGPVDDPAPKSGAARLDDPTLNAAAALVDDIERTRIAAEHRLRILTRPTDEADEDGMCRGHGVPEDHPTPAALRAVAEALAGVEHQAVLELQRAMRRHPLGPWVKSSKGIGEKQGARLLAAVGDPYFNARDQRPRTVSQLWAYCGLHTLPAGQARSTTHSSGVGGDQTGGDPGPWTSDDQRRTARVAARRRKGERANWSTTAKTRAYLVAVSCMKSPGSPYRDLYLSRREHTAMTHPEWTAGHSHNDALRIVAKRVLRDAWRAARDIHVAAEEAAA